jgi:hypothetical protein
MSTLRGILRMSQALASDKKFLALLHFRRLCHIRRSEGIGDGAAHDLAGFNGILGGGGMVGFGVPDNMINVRFERHLQVSAGSQVSARGIRVERMGKQADAGLLPDAERASLCPLSFLR